MKLEVISISNKLTKWEDETLKFYLKQISSFANITIQNIKPAQGRNLSIKEVQINEEKDILKRIKPNSLIISFDRKGNSLIVCNSQILLKNSLVQEGAAVL